jgi:Tol biopolymer transport system component
VKGPLVVYQFNETFVELFTLDPFNGRKVALGTLQKASSAMGQSIHWSADRKRALVFADSDTLQFVVDVDLGTVEPVGLTSSGARDAVSPAADLVARVEDEGGNGSSLSIVDLDDIEVLRAALPAGMQASSDIAWSPDGTSVLVNGCLPCDGSPGEQHDHVYSVQVGDGTIRDVADSTSGSFGWLRWSPDMATIAFSRCADTCPAGIGIMGSRDGHAAQLTTTADRSPAWSPDGRRIAFARDSGAGRGIYVMDADGGNLARLTSAAIDNGDRSPLWSRDGAWIVFTRWADDGSLGDLYIVSSTGGEPRLLVQNAVADW